MVATDQRFLDIYEKELKDYNNKLKEREDEIKRKEDEKKIFSDKLNALYFNDATYKDDISICVFHTSEPAFDDSKCQNLVREKNIPEKLAKYAKRYKADFKSCSTSHLFNLDHTVYCKYPDGVYIDEIEFKIKNIDDDLKILRNKKIIKPKLENIIIQTCNNNTNCTTGECKSIKQSCDQLSKTENDISKPLPSDDISKPLPPAFAGKRPDDISKPLPPDMNFNINYIYIGTTVFMIILIIIIIILYLSKKSK